jgi:methionyl-tRNA synthetase
VRVAAILLLPIIPKSAEKILSRVGEPAPVKDLTLTAAGWRNEGERALHKGDALWPRIEAPRSGASKGQGPPARSGASTGQGRGTRVSEQPKEPTAPTPAGTPAPVASDPNAGRISIDDFMKVDMRVAKVLAAEKVPNSRKLMKLQIDVGAEQRTLVAGIAEAYEPDQLVGRSVGVVFNLKPAKLMGIESNGMVLAASPDGGKPTLVTFDGDVPAGSRIR